MDNIELYLLIISFLMLLSVLSSKLSDKFGIPALFIFLGLGMLAGSDGILGIHFDNAELAQSVGTLALIFILFGGGLDTKWAVIKPVLKDGLILATLGVFLTALFVAV
ncbi:MAG: cation:proton antiporter, partial [Arcobacteraceae bacterium]